MRISHSKGFHSVMVMQSRRIGFLRVKQKRARAGLSANLFTGFRTTRGLACLSLLLAVPVTPANGCPIVDGIGDGVMGVGVGVGVGVGGACIFKVVYRRLPVKVRLI